MRKLKEELQWRRYGLKILASNESLLNLNYPRGRRIISSSPYSQSFPYDSHAHTCTDHQGLHRVLEACRLYLDSRTATVTHTRIIKCGYETYPSLLASLVSTYKHCGYLKFAHKVLDRVFSTTHDLVYNNIIIESLMKTGECKLAKRVFLKMHARDVVSWNSTIGGYVKNSHFQEALNLFKEMLSLNVEPDGFTFASVITGCARLGALNNAQWAHSLMIEKRIELNFILSAALIDMYSKCGRICTAKEVFDRARRDDVSVWNAMINGLASHRLAAESIAVFSKMELENVLPNSITFIAILTACSHCGLVEEGRKYFDLMQKRFSIVPQLEHYGAMVDLLGRSGLMEEAYAMIKAMPMEPDFVIWRALLCACRNYRNQVLAEVAIAKISHLESGDFVLISNMYCSLNKWDSAEKVRRMMKAKGIHKNRGKSWIELGSTLHQFKAADQSHPEIKSIYRVLEGLNQRAKVEGFVPSRELVLMDVSEEEKEENLSCHSEKLALAYGILKSSPGTEIKILKNLRTCHDCHGWLKTVSRVLCRVIIVRDRIRFHRFEGGLCSCADYW